MALCRSCDVAEDEIAIMNKAAAVGCQGDRIAVIAIVDVCSSPLSRFDLPGLGVVRFNFGCANRSAAGGAIVYVVLARRSRGDAQAAFIQLQAVCSSKIHM